MMFKFKDSLVEKTTRLIRVGIFAIIPFVLSLGPFAYMVRTLEIIR